MSNKRDKEGNKKRTNISLDPKLLPACSRICEKEERSLSNLVTIALKHYIAEYEAKESK